MNIQMQRRSYSVKIKTIERLKIWRDSIIVLNLRAVWRGLQLIFANMAKIFASLYNRMEMT